MMKKKDIAYDKDNNVARKSPSSDIVESVRGVTLGRKLVLGVSVGLLFVVLGVAYWVNVVNTPDNKTPSGDTVDSRIVNPEEEFKRKDGERRKAAQELLDNADGSEERARAYIDMSNAYIPSDYPKALEYAKKAVEESPTVEYYKILGHLADIVGEKDTLDLANQKIGELGGFSDEW